VQLLQGLDKKIENEKSLSENILMRVNLWYERDDSSPMKSMIEDRARSLDMSASAANKASIMSKVEDDAVYLEVSERTSVNGYNHPHPLHY